VGDEPAQVIRRARDQQHRRGRAHAALVGLGLGAVVDVAARRLDGVLEDLQDLDRLHRLVVDPVALDQIAVLVHRVADLVHRDRRRDLTRRVPTHPVRHQEEPELLVDEEVVLVVRPLPTHVSRGGEGQLHHPESITAVPSSGPGAPAARARARLRPAATPPASR
jgi:hypothetical protein